MSLDALAWTVRHSPLKGAGLNVHMMLADSANDQHNHELWMSMETLGEKSRVHRKTAASFVADLARLGFLEVLEPPVDDEGKGTGKPGRYRFLFPADAVVVYDTRGGARDSTPARRARRDTPPPRRETPPGRGERPREPEVEPQEHPEDPPPKPSPDAWPTSTERLGGVGVALRAVETILARTGVEASGRHRRTMLATATKLAKQGYDLDAAVDFVAGEPLDGARSRGAVLAGRLRDVPNHLQPVAAVRAAQIERARTHGARLAAANLEAHQVRETLEGEYRNDPELAAAALEGAGEAA